MESMCGRHSAALVVTGRPGADPSRLRDRVDSIVFDPQSALVRRVVGVLNSWRIEPHGSDEFAPRPELSGVPPTSSGKSGRAADQLMIEKENVFEIDLMPDCNEVFRKVTNAE